MKTKSALAYVIFAAIFAEAAFLNAAEPSAGQTAQRFEKQIVVKLDYLLSVPADYNKGADKKWPLMLFLHGSGECGSDVNKVKKHGPPHVIDENPDCELARRFIVVSPQNPAHLMWKADELMALLDEIQGRYRVDEDRVYLTGLSLGGFGTWLLAETYPKRFAAIAPVCGGGCSDLAFRLKKTPVWIFHGEQDKTVPIALSESMAAALKKAGADVKFTRYPDLGHDCWTKTYANPELYEWFLSHKRGQDAKPTETEKTDKK